jgi:hypothetical protein
LQSTEPVRYALRSGSLVIVDGKFIIKAGIVRRRLGRPGTEPQQIEQARQLLAQGKRFINTV